MIDPTSADIGRLVIYRDKFRGLDEEGVITSFSDKWVFVRYAGTHPQATHRTSLDWVTPEKED